VVNAEAVVVIAKDQLDEGEHNQIV